MNELQGRYTLLHESHRWVRMVHAVVDFQQSSRLRGTWCRLSQRPTEYAEYSALRERLQMWLQEFAALPRLSPQHLSARKVRAARRHWTTFRKTTVELQSDVQAWTLGETEELIKTIGAVDDMIDVLRQWLMVL